MTDGDSNPYAPPKAAVADEDQQPSPGNRGSRPFEVTVLTIAAIWGMLTNVVPFLLFGGMEQQIAMARSLGLSATSAVVSAVLLPSLWAATSVGLWWGRPQGWWCASFLYQERILRYGWLLSLDLTGAAGAGNIGNHVMILVAVVVQCLVLYTINPRTWTGVSGWSLKWLVLLPVLAVFSLNGVMAVLRGLLPY